MGSFFTTLKNMGASRLVAIAAVGLFLLGFLVYLTTSLNKTDMAVLFNELDSADAKKIISKLEEENVDYRLTKNGTEVLVPIDKVLKMRVELAENVGSGAVVGYELFDKAQSPGVGQEVIKLQMLRALEGELARTIRAIDHVKGVRVHLVLPRREMFTRDEQKPSASVILRMEDGKGISPKQVEAIQKLVASSVPKMETKMVSIVDSKGNLLTKNFEDDDQAQITTNEEMRRDLERRMTNAVMSMLERSVGSEKVRVNVSLEMDFDQLVISKESYNPDEQVLRSSTTIEEKNQSDEREPIVSVQENIPDAEGKNINQVSQQGSKTEETQNFEISKQTTSQVRKQGVIKRISVAVIVDGTYKAGENGAREFIPRTEQEMEQLTTLAKSAVGFNEDRGDVVEVVNMQFYNPEDMLNAEDPIIFMGFTKKEVMKMVEGIGVAIVSILVILLVIRPLIAKAFEQSEELKQQEEALMLSQGDLRMIGSDGRPVSESDELDELIDVAKVEGRVKGSTMKKIGEIIDQHPQEALAIVRSWLYDNK